MGGHRQAKPCVLSLETLTVRALSKQPRSGVSRARRPALGPRPLLATLGDELRDLSREHGPRWTRGTLCLQVQLWPGPDPRAGTWLALGFSEGKLRGMPSAHVPAGQGFACPLGPLLERGGGARLRAGVSDSRCPGPSSGLSSLDRLLCLWALKAGWAGRHCRSMV